MAISQHLERLAGLKVVDFEPGAGFGRRRPGKVAYRIAAEPEGDEEDSLPALLDRYLAEREAADTTALVVGAWKYDDMLQWGRGSRDVIEALTAARDRLPKLRALFLGDVTYEQCEISWLTQGDLSPLLAAYPDLEEFRVRGVQNLTFGRLRHNSLRTLAVESGGLPAGILEEIWSAKLPQVECLELLLGTANYGGIDDVAPLKRLLSGRLFPRLTYLGLRNSDIADAVAKAVARSKLLERLRVLDLSLGNLTDEGARALLASPAVANLEKLDIHHHYVSPEVVRELKRLKIRIDAGDVCQPDVYTRGDETHVRRFNSHSE